MHNVIIQTAFIGDLLLSIPLIRNTKNLFPEDRLVLVCRKGFGAFFKESGLVDDVIEIEKSKPASYRAAAESLGRFSIRHVIAPHQSFRTALLVRSLQVSGLKVGFRRWWNGVFFDKRVVRPMQYPDAIRQVSLLAGIDSRFSETFSQDLLGIDENLTVLNTVALQKRIPDWATMQVARNNGDVSVGSQSFAAWNKDVADRKDLVREQNDLNGNKGAHRDLLAEIGKKKRGKTVLVAPGSAWPTKRWDWQGFSQLLRDLMKDGFEVKLIGTKDEIEICHYIKKQVPEVQSLAGRTTISEMIQLMSSAAALISNDSGAMHMAAVAGLPVVSIFGPTTLSLGYRPWNDNAIVVQKSMNCRPCSAHGTKHCPLKTHACMREISSAEVMTAFKQLGV